MARKRKTLPDEFNELLKSGTLEEQKACMLRCLPNAAGDYYKYNAFGFPGISEDFAHWLLEYGTDINMPDYFGYTPLHHQAMRRDGTAQAALYLSLGADISASSHLDGGPLHGAADHGCTENVKLLLAHGADFEAKDHWGQTPMEFSLSRCGGADITDKIDALTLLIDAGASITEKMRESVTRIGKDIEFRRDKISPDWLPAVDAALGRLYSLFDVPPVPKRRFHDGKSPIQVTAQDWQGQYQELWDYLVPASGACQTVQGEAVRINGRVSHEFMGNGGANWDKGFRAMLKALTEYLSMGTPLPAEELAEATRLALSINGRSGLDVDLDRLCQLSVQWVLNNPEPLLLGETSYRR